MQFSLVISEQSAVMFVGLVDRSQVGSVPVNRLVFRNKASSLDNFFMSVPTLPVNRLSDRFKDVSCFREYNSVGRLPDNLFEETSSDVRRVPCPISVGSEPGIWLFERSIESTWAKANRSPGNSPLIPELANSRQQKKCQKLVH
jgi:hypothetical protein